MSLGMIVRPETAFHVMTKPSGPACNLRCRYCFYLEKFGLYPATRFRMPDDVLDAYVRKYIESQQVPEVTFAWQGGEPTLMGLDFFRRAVDLQQRYANGKIIRNSLQTNGTLLNEEWCRFFHQEQFLIGISVDGPADLHDTYRVDRGDKPTHARVMNGLHLLRQHRVDFNTLTVVNRRNALEPLRVYDFLKNAGSSFLQFIPLVEREPGGTNSGNALSLSGPGMDDSAQVTEWSVRPGDYGKFLCTIFDEWVKRDVGSTFVQMFDVTLGSWAQMGGSLCIFSETCGKAVAMEHNGDVYACDHFVYPEYKLGNFLETPFPELINSDRQQAFGTAKKTDLPNYCRQCIYRFACNGGCPKHRFMKTPTGEDGLNYFCEAFRRFFRHTAQPMQEMAVLIRSGRPAAEIMGKYGHSPADSSSPRRNQPCPCGSGKKYKHCCAFK